MYDHVPERVWRHLDTCECQTFLHARLPGVDCPKHGVVQVGAGWAERDSKTAVAMESRCIDVLQECDVSGAGRLTRLSWRAVARGRDRKAHRLPRYIGVDEKSFAKGHEYETLVCDLRRGTVEYVEDVGGRRVRVNWSGRNRHWRGWAGAATMWGRGGA